MELKFRAWYKEDLDCGVFMKFESIRFQDNIKFEWNDDVTKHPFTYDMGMIIGDDDWLVEQYTNLKDKNGKEIYIGDIVNFKAFTRNKLECGVIDYHNGSIYIPNFSGYSDEYIVGAYDLEVIGNIHENKDLLK